MPIAGDAVQSRDGGQRLARNAGGEEAAALSIEPLEHGAEMRRHGKRGRTFDEGGDGTSSGRAT